MKERGAHGSAVARGPSEEETARHHAPSKPLRFDRRRPDPIRHALHDRLGPRLAGLELRLSLLEEAAPQVGLTSEQLTDVRQEVSDLITEFGRIVHGEPPEALERGGLVFAVSEACRSAEVPGTPIDFVVRGAEVRLPRATAELLYRAALEGTANVVRHARASRCLVRLSFDGSSAVLEVRDNGRGWSPRQAGTGEAAGLGLTSLWRAARKLGGSARLEALPGAGSRLIVSLPLRRRVRRGARRASGAQEAARQP